MPNQNQPQPKPKLTQHDIELQNRNHKQRHASIEKILVKLEEIYPPDYLSDELKEKWFINNAKKSEVEKEGAKIFKQIFKV